MIFDVGNTLLHVDYTHVARVLGAQGHAVAPEAIRAAEYAASQTYAAYTCVRT